jgi:hypothetical protein
VLGLVALSDHRAVADVAAALFSAWQEAGVAQPDQVRRVMARYL